MAAHSDKPRHGTCAEAAQANRCAVLPVVCRGPPKRWAHAPDRSSTPPPPRHILPNARPTACANAFWSGPCTATPSDSTDAVSAIAGRSVLALIRRSSSRACISSTSYRQFTLAPDASLHAKRSFSSPHDSARARSGGARVALAVYTAVEATIIPVGQTVLCGCARSAIQCCTARRAWRALHYSDFDIVRKGQRSATQRKGERMRYRT